MRSENTPRPIPAGLPRIDPKSWVDGPVEGFYRVTITRGGPWVAAKVWYGPPLDPEPPHEPLDRYHRWQALRAGREWPVENIGPIHERDRITEAEYRHLLEVAAWATAHAPDAPEATPGKAIDMLTAPCPW